MATKDYHDAMVSDEFDDAARDEKSRDSCHEGACGGCKGVEHNLGSIYRVVRSIEELVSEIRDDLGGFLEGRSNGHDDYRYLDDDYGAGVMF